MNAKLVKKMRRAARRLSVGLPDRQLQLVNCHNKVVGSRVDLVTGVEMPVLQYVCQAVQVPRTTRGIYRAIKKGHKAEVRRAR